MKYIQYEKRYGRVFASPCKFLRLGFLLFRFFFPLFFFILSNVDTCLFPHSLFYLFFKKKYVIFYLKRKYHLRYLIKYENCVFYIKNACLPFFILFFKTTKSNGSLSNIKLVSYYKLLVNQNWKLIR